MSTKCPKFRFRNCSYFPRYMFFKVRFITYFFSPTGRGIHCHSTLFGTNGRCGVMLLHGYFCSMKKSSQKSVRMKPSSCFIPSYHVFLMSNVFPMFSTHFWLKNSTIRVDFADTSLCGHIFWCYLHHDPKAGSKPYRKVVITQGADPTVVAIRGEAQLTSVNGR